MNVPKKKRGRATALAAPIPAERISYSIKETARLLGVSPRLVKSQVADGTLPSFKCGGRRLVARTALEKFMVSSRQA